MTEPSAAQAASDNSQAMPQGALGAWWWQGARTAFLMRPHWTGLHACPATIACLVAMPFLLGALVQRLYITGPANFYWPALQTGWLATAVSVWVCWLLVPAANPATPPERAPSAAALFALMAAQSLTLTGALALALVPMVRAGLFAGQALGTWGHWLAWGLPLAWVGAAQLLLAWRSGTQRARPRGFALALLGGTLLLSPWTQPMPLWYADESAANARAAQPLRLTQELLESQPRTLADRLSAIAPQRPGVIDVYAITFAPYAEEDVFMRESRMVAGVIEDRFDARGRTIELVNHRDTLRLWPWATPLNLQRAIQRAAERMDRDEDVLFIHLTSHGAKSGELAAGFWPLTIDAVTPQALKRWLDEAGIRHRVISISACYSGSWIEPLASDDTLVMTAADADHTSFGCGRGSALTYFGRAMFDEQLRKTWSFEAAHAEARLVIDKREREAGKDDGYSNPQIRVGTAIREHLARLALQRRSAAK